MGIKWYLAFNLYVLITHEFEHLIINLLVIFTTSYINKFAVYILGLFFFLTIIFLMRKFFHMLTTNTLYCGQFLGSLFCPTDLCVSSSTSPTSS